MNNVMWIVISAAVMLALSGFVLFVGSNGLEDVNDDGEDVQNDAICGFQEDEVEADRLSCDEISSRCEGEIEACN